MFMFLILNVQRQKHSWLSSRDLSDIVITMAFLKEESEDIKIEDAIRVKQEDTEEQTGWFSFSKLNSVI